MSQFEYQKREIDRLTSEYNEKKMEVDRLQRRVQEIEDQLQQENRSKMLLLETNQKLQEMVQQQGSKNKAEDPTVVPKAKYTSLLKEYEAILRLSEELKKKYEIKDNLLKELSQQSSTIQSDNEVMKEQLKEKDEKISQLERNVGELQQTIRDEREKEKHFQEIENENYLLLQEIDNDKLEMGKFKEEINKMDDQIKVLENELRLEKEKNLEKLNESGLESSTESSRAAPVTNIYQEENERLKNEIEKYKRQIDQYKEDAKLVVEWVDREKNSLRPGQKGGQPPPGIVRTAAPGEIVILRSKIEQLENELSEVTNEKEMLEKIYNGDIKEDGLQRAIEENNNLQLEIRRLEEDKQVNDKFYGHLREYIEYLHKKYNIPIDEFNNFKGSNVNDVNLLKPGVDLAAYCNNLEEENKRLQAVLEACQYLGYNNPDLPKLSYQNINKVLAFIEALLNNDELLGPLEYKERLAESEEEIQRLKNELHKQKREYDSEISNIRNDYEEKLDKLRNSMLNNNTNNDNISNEKYDSLINLIQELKDKVNNTPTVTIPMQGGGNADNSEIMRRLDEIEEEILDNTAPMNPRQSMLYKAGYGSRRSLFSPGSRQGLLSPSNNNNNLQNQQIGITIDPNGLNPEGLSGIRFFEEYKNLISSYPPEIQDELINIYGLLLYTVEELYSQDVDLDEISNNLKQYAKNITQFLDIQYQLYEEYHKKVKSYNETIEEKDKMIEKLQNELQEFETANNEYKKRLDVNDPHSDKNRLILEHAASEVDKLKLDREKRYYKIQCNQLEDENNKLNYRLVNIETTLKYRVLYLELWKKGAMYTIETQDNIMKEYLKHRPKDNDSMFDKQFLIQILETTDVLTKQDELNQLRRENSELKRINNLQKQDIEQKNHELKSKDEINKSILKEKGITADEAIAVIRDSSNNQYKQMYEEIKRKLNDDIDKLQRDLNAQTLQNNDLRSKIKDLEKQISLSNTADDYNRLNSEYEHQTTQYNELLDELKQIKNTNNELEIKLKHATESYNILLNLYNSTNCIREAQLEKIKSMTDTYADIETQPEVIEQTIEQLAQKDKQEVLRLLQEKIDNAMSRTNDTAIIAKLHEQLYNYKTNYQQLEKYKTNLVNDLKQKEITIQTLDRACDKLKEKYMKITQDYKKEMQAMKEYILLLEQGKGNSIIKTILNDIQTLKRSNNELSKKVESMEQQLIATESEAERLKIRNESLENVKEDVEQFKADLEKNPLNNNHLELWNKVQLTNQKLLEVRLAEYNERKQLKLCEADNNRKDSQLKILEAELTNKNKYIILLESELTDEQFSHLLENESKKTDSKDIESLMELINNRIKSYKENNQMDVDYEDQQMMFNQTQNSNNNGGNGGDNNNDAKTLQELVKFKNENEELNNQIKILKNEIRYKELEIESQRERMKINGIGNDDDDDDDRKEQIRLKNRKLEELQNKLAQEINNHNNDNHLAKQTIEQTKAIIEEKQKVIEQYEQQIEDMRNNLTGEREKIRKQYDEKYKKIIEDKNAEIERLHDNLLNGPNNNSPTKQALTIQKIQEINEQLLDRCQMSEDELAKSRNVINHLEQQLDHAQNERDRFEEQYKQLHIRVDELQEKLDRLDAMNSSTKKFKPEKIHRTLNEVENDYKTKLAKLEKKVMELKVINEDNKKKISDLESNVDREVDKRTIQVQEENNNLQNEVKSLKNKLKTVKDKVKQVKNESDEEIKKLQSDVDNLHKEVDDYRNERDNLRQEIQRIEDQKSEIIGKTKKIEKELLQSKRKTMNEEKEDNAKDLQILKLQKEIKKLTIANKALESIQAVPIQESPALPEPPSRSEEKTNISPNRYESLYKNQEIELKRTKSELNKITKKYDILTQKFTEIKQQLDVVEKNLDEERRRNKQLQGDRTMKKKKDINSEMTKEDLLKEYERVQEYKNEIFRLEEENNKLKRQVEVDQEQNITKLKYKINLLQNDVDRLTSDNERLRKEIGETSTGGKVAPYSGEDRNIILSEKLENTLNRVMELENENLELKFQAESSMSEINSLRRRIADLEQYKTVVGRDSPITDRKPGERFKRERDYESVIDGLKTVIEKQKIEIERLKNNSITNIEYMKVKNDLKEQKRLNNQYLKEMDELRNQLASKQSGKYIQQKKQNVMVDTENQVKEKQKQLLLLESDNISLKRKISSLENELEEANNIIMKNKSERSSGERASRLRELENALSDANKQIEILKKEPPLAVNAKEMSRLENELENMKKDKNEEIKVLKKKLEDEKIVNMQLRNELSAFDSNFFDEIEDLKYKYCKIVEEKKAFKKHMEECPYLNNRY